MSKMKEIRVFKGPRTELHDAELPELPSPLHMIIKVIVSGMNPKDWGIAERVQGVNQGDDIAGVVYSVGTEVRNFRPGDRVASFHEMLTPGGSFAEYAVGLEATTLHIPDDVSFEEAATIPLACTTAALGLYQRLDLPTPWRPCQERLPMVIYGAASAVGAFALKLANLSNIHPLICVAGRGIPYVETLIDRSKGDTVIDYRRGHETVVNGIREVLKPDEKLLYAFDAVTDHGSWQNLMQIMDHKVGKLAIVLARKRYDGIPQDFQLYFTQVGKVHAEHYQGLKGQKTLDGPLPGDQEFGSLIFRFFERGLAQGWLRGHPYQIIPGGLNGVEKGLKALKAGEASATKFVVRISETTSTSAVKL